MDQQEFDFLLGDARIDIASDVIEAIEQTGILERVEFFGFDEDFFVNADLAEIVEQSGVAQLLHLLARKTQVGVRTLGLAIDGLGERNGHFTDTLGMAGGGGIALLDSFYGSVHETVEKVFDVAVELGVFVGHGGL